MTGRITVVIFLFTILGRLHATPVVIASPQRAQVKVFSGMANMGLHWNSDADSLVASITFSNVNYVSPGESLGDETVAFALPGVKYDSTDHAFYKVSDDERIPVATMVAGVFGRRIKLAPGARILALDNHGTISVMLVATREPVTGSQWLRVEEEPALKRMFASAEGTTHRP